MQVLLSVSQGLISLDARGRSDLKTAVDAETETWRTGTGQGGMLHQCGGSVEELRRRLDEMARRPELTDEQRAIVSILQGRARRLAATP